MTTTSTVLLPVTTPPSKQRSDASQNASLFSSLQSVHPAVGACFMNTVCSISLTLANKHIFSVNFHHQWALLGIQSFIVTVLLILFQLLSRNRPLSFTLLRQMFLPCILFTSYIFTNARALNYISLPILSVLKSLAPLGIAVSERILFSDPITKGVAIAMFLIIAGNATTIFNDLQFSLPGYAWSFFNVLINIGYVISLRVCLSDKFSPVEKTLHSNFIAACILLPIAHISGETATFLTAFSQTDSTFRNVYFLSCLLAACIGVSIFYVIQTSSGSTLSFIGACNKFVLVMLSAMIFKDRISFAGWISVCFGIVAGIVFTVAKAKAAGQANVSSDSDDNSETSDMDEAIEFINSEDELSDNLAKT